LPPVQNRLDDIRRQQRHAQQPTHVGRVDLLRRRNLLAGPLDPGLQQLAPAETAGEDLKHGVADPGARGSPGRCVIGGGIRLLAAAVLADGEVPSKSWGHSRAA
jgi:hypothetical protein